jgi:DNA-binding transcriptional regulator PaaX
MKHAKTDDRQISRRLSRGRRLSFRLLAAVDCAAIFFHGTYRHRQVAVIEGLGGLRRVMRGEERRSAIKRLHDLRRRGLIREKRRRDRVELTLTEHGRGALLRFRVSSAPRRSDAKRLMAAFDIPETHRHARALLRQLLRSSGFRRLQDSVWITDRDAAEALSEWSRVEGIRDWVRVFVVEEI